MKLPNRNKARLEERRASAAERKAAYAVLTPDQKLASLDQRLGKGVGAVRERTRLALALSVIHTGTVSKATAEAVFGVKGQKSHGPDTKP